MVNTAGAPGPSLQGYRPCIPECKAGIVCLREELTNSEAHKDGLLPYPTEPTRLPFPNLNYSLIPMVYLSLKMDISQETTTGIMYLKPILKHQRCFLTLSLYYAIITLS